MKKTVGIVLAFLFVLSLAACSMSRKMIVGKYELTKAEGPQFGITQGMLDAAKILGATATMDVNEDGTAVMDLFGQKLEMTYDLNKMVFILDGSSQKFTFDGKIITIKDDENILQFTKIS